MKTKMFLCAIFALLVTCVSPCFASVEDQTLTPYFSSDKSYVCYDTVEVVACATVEYVEKVEYLNGFDIKVSGYEVLVVFSNKMMYSHYLSSDDLDAELEENSRDHIYNVKKGDKVIVALKISPKESKIIDFVANLSNR